MSYIGGHSVVGMTREQYAKFVESEIKQGREQRERRKRKERKKQKRELEELKKRIQRNPDLFK